MTEEAYVVRATGDPTAAASVLTTLPMWWSYSMEVLALVSTGPV